MRVDRRRTIFNLRFKRRYKQAIKKHIEAATIETLKRMYALVDRAAKKGIIHKNKAARLKSWGAKLMASKTSPKPAKKTKGAVKPKKATKKTTKNKKADKPKAKPAK